MRYLHTLKVRYVLVHNVHYASLRSKQTQLTNPVTNSRVAIWEINPSLYRGKQSTCAQIEHI